MEEESAESSRTAGAAQQMTLESPTLPIPIFRLDTKSPRYMLYDIDTVSWLRQEHHILGVAVGGMPQFPQQNVFFGLPIELMLEEVRLLVDDHVAYIVDDYEGHKRLMEGMARGDAKALQQAQDYRQRLQDIAKDARDEVARAKQQRADEVRSKHGRKKRQSTAEAQESSSGGATKLPASGEHEHEADTDTLWGDDGSAARGGIKSSNPDPKSKAPEPSESAAWTLTPTASTLLFPPSSLTPSPRPVEDDDARYDVFRRLHDAGYYMTPGLRFGCHFTAYPGDPLRFHSHFLATGAGWDEEFDLLDVVAGGRLGTGVKKGYLLGGRQPPRKANGIDKDDSGDGQVRTFCIEWGGM